MKRKNTHICKILKRLIRGEALTSNDVFASNSNQYFRAIKKRGVALVEVRKNNSTNDGTHLERSLLLTPENISHARVYLDNLCPRKKSLSPSK